MENRIVKLGDNMATGQTENSFKQFWWTEVLF